MNLVIGVFICSALWWFALSNVVSLFKTILNNKSKSLIFVNKFSGIIVFIFGVVAIYSGVV